MFEGFIDLAGTLRMLLMSKSTGNAPVDADALPTWRAYGQGGFLLAGTAALLENGNITGVTNTNPAVITSNGHGLSVGSLVTIANVVGGTGVNGTFRVTAVTANTFTIVAVPSGAYVSGGTWHSTALYAIDVVASAGNGFESGKTYTVAVNYQLSSVNYAQLFSFTVT